MHYKDDLPVIRINDLYWLQELLKTETKSGSKSCFLKCL